MKTIFTHILTWLTGKKTYILTTLIVLVTVALVALGWLTPEVAMAIALIFLGLFAASFHSFLAAHQQQSLQTLIDIAALIKALATHNPTAARQIGPALLSDGIALAGDIPQSAAPAATAQTGAPTS